MLQPSGQGRNFFRCRFASNDAFGVFSGYDIGSKHNVSVNNSLKLCLNKQISRLLLGKTAYRKLRKPDIACIQNGKLVRLVTPVKS